MANREGIPQTMSITNPRMAEREKRMHALYDLHKRDVLRLWREGAGRNHVWSAAPPSTWSKDDLIGAILEHELGAPRMCGQADPDTGLLCRVAAGTIHDTHAYAINPADVKTDKI